ncbi:MAG: TlpA family protein disulfide reductase [Candidatus Nealsonbacteria bacterium]|nr:TlpA family protein disulfide reductase [Candidatus Nealsonbacteria bacterium]
MHKIKYANPSVRATATAIVCAATFAIGLLATVATSCPAAEQPPVDEKAPADASEKTDKDPDGPCLTGDPKGKPSIDTKTIPRFGGNSPFDGDAQIPEIRKERRLWADSWRWSKGPKLVVEEWLTDEPKTEGKYVLVEFWATWCPPCRRSIPLLNGFHKKFGKELVVIGISEETSADVRKMKEPQIEFHCAVDTQKRMKDELGVWGIPHIILMEPDGYVVWEGFPLQPGFELTDEIVDKILAVGRKLKAKEKQTKE